MKKTFALILILALVFCMAVPTFAVAPPPAVKGQTTVGIQVYDYDPTDLDGSVSFTVPLYVTLAVVQNLSNPASPQSKVMAPAPDQYQIKNGNATGGSNLAVTSLDVKKVATGSTWSLVAGTPTATNQLQMSLGTANSTLVQLTEKKFIEKVGFITPPNEKPDSTSVITPTTPLTLPINAAIATGFKYDKADVAPQFTLKYTLQPLNSDGTYVNAKSYVGDNAKDAGYTVP
ncbi:MAG: hypothetical protein RSC58_00285 [Ruthenibacterium sp.]